MTSFVETRTALHQLARFVLGEELKGTTDLVTLRATPGGFGQPERLVDRLQRRLRVDGTSLVLQHGEHETWTDITTVAAACDLAGIAVRADVPAPDAPLPVGAAHAGALAHFYAFVESVLSELRRRHLDDAPTIPQLFPHHFDLAVTIAEVNIGGSPGDDDHEEPYLYVSPWSLRPAALWNEPWGASMPWTERVTVADALDFFESASAVARGGGRVDASAG
jgi:hypothetical protein